jgi:hypothetical protein
MAFAEVILSIVSGVDVMIGLWVVLNTVSLFLHHDTKSGSLNVHFFRYVFMRSSMESITCIITHSRSTQALKLRPFQTFGTPTTGKMFNPQSVWMTGLTKVRFTGKWPWRMMETLKRYGE